MRLPGMTKSRNSLLDGVAMTAMERRVGRYMRAPDHPTGDPAPAAPAADPAPADDPAPVITPPADPAPAVGGEDDGDDTALGGKKPDAADPADPADPAPDAPVVPEAYELTAPEGMTIDADLLTEATPIFKELGLSNEAASKVLPLAQSLIAKTQDATVQQFIEQGNQQRKAWLDEAKADPEIGGNKWDTTLHTAGRGLDALGYGEGSALRTLLNETGLGNHPEMIKAMAKIGGMVGEDGDFVRADAGAKVEETREERWYGKKG